MIRSLKNINKIRPNSYTSVVSMVLPGIRIDYLNGWIVKKGEVSERND